MARRYGRGADIQRAIKAEFAAVEPSADEDLHEFIDDWSGSAIPMSATKHL